jgi:hypothetical protein
MYVEVDDRKSKTYSVEFKAGNSPAMYAHRGDNLGLNGPDPDLRIFVAADGDYGLVPREPVAEPYYRLTR